MRDDVELVRRMGRAVVRDEGGVDWSSTSFVDVATRPGKQSGLWGERVFAELCERHGFEVDAGAPGKGDRRVSGAWCEVKTAFENRGGGFAWFHVQEGYEFDVLVLLGIRCSDEVYVWVMRKEEGITMATPAPGEGQWQMSFRFSNPPGWAWDSSGWGGNLERVDFPRLLARVGVFPGVKEKLF